MAKYFIRLVKGRPRLFFSLLFSILVGLMLPSWLDIKFSTRLIIVFNSGIILYLIMAAQMMFYSEEKDIVKRAALQDEGKILILFLVIGSATMSLIAIVGQLSVAKEFQGLLKFEHIALASLTIMVSWIFTHLMFAVHYAHEYYLNLSNNKPAGLIFPGNELPDYADFMYFSISIGTSGQTSDICFSDRKMRRAGMVHCMFSFFFNTTVLALTINILAGLF